MTFARKVFTQTFSLKFYDGIIHVPVWDKILPEKALRNMSSVAKGKSELRFANELNYDVCIREKGEKPPSEQFVALGVGEKKQDILL